MYAPGYETEYAQNFCIRADRVLDDAAAKEMTWKELAQVGRVDIRSEPQAAINHPAAPNLLYGTVPTDEVVLDPAKFNSTKYPSMYRELRVNKDDKGQYIDPRIPYNAIASKPCGRRLIYDDTHPEKMYPSQWSSELADEPGCYSFPTTTGLKAEIPWTKDMSWQKNGEQGDWPTQEWKTWTKVATCPPYNGHTDQVEYAKYKTVVP